ncbi:MAG: response regulator [Candidatus Omnitrophota bacterium]
MDNTILIVDDEPDLVSMVKMRLEANNYNILTASSGEEALIKAKSAKPDLILLDIEMPGLTGLETLRRLKDNLETKSTAVIMLTAKGDPASISEAGRLGVSYYLRKPFDTEELLSMVNKSISGGQEEG